MRAQQSRDGREPEGLVHPNNNQHNCRPGRRETINPLPVGGEIRTRAWEFVKRWRRFPALKSSDISGTLAPEQSAKTPPFFSPGGNLAPTPTKPEKGEQGGLFGASGAVSRWLVAPQKLIRRLPAAASHAGEPHRVRAPKATYLNGSGVRSSEGIVACRSTGASCHIKSTWNSFNRTETSAFFLVAIGSRYRQRKNRSDDVRAQRETPRFF